MDARYPQPTARYFTIDLLRFKAALAVLLFHYTFRGFAADNLSPVPYPGLSGYTQYGYLGVELFFIISGYVVLLSAYKKTVREFILSRAIRLYPAFWVACTAAFIATYCLGPGRGSKHWSALMDVSLWQYLCNMTMVHKLMGVRDLDGVYWTLTYEIQFYFLIATLLLVNWLRHLPLLMAGWLIYTAVAPFFAYRNPLTILLFPAYSPLFIAGMCFFLLHDHLAVRWQLYLLLLASWGLSLRNGLSYAQLQADYYKTPFSAVVVVGLISSFYVVFWCISTARIRMKERQWLYWAGALTYPLYLIHHNIGYVIYQRLGPFLNNYVLLVGITLLMLAAAYGLHVYIEQPLSQALKRRFSPHKRRYSSVEQL
ncbi:acyltransferase [Fibrella sp. HMF5335]|uniref:Acyltransferase n=1 Tax=Fibrella rubiginis TaxID=2817060 RepID=A0A939GK37_9BACT|nr:acyltransferase [Fibrella rubiginis]MBO0938885.1 acyltransferase [Fibrella rubiginis]